MFPLAPARFSTTTDAFQSSPSFCPSVRARISMPVPGVNGTISLIGLLGEASCAGAIPPGATTEARQIERIIGRDRGSMKTSLFARRCLGGGLARRNVDARDALVAFRNGDELVVADDVLDARERLVAGAL